MLCFVPGFFVLNRICFEEKKEEKKSMVRVMIWASHLGSDRGLLDFHRLGTSHRSPQGVFLRPPVLGDFGLLPGGGGLELREGHPGPL